MPTIESPSEARQLMESGQQQTDLNGPTFRMEFRTYGSAMEKRLHIKTALQTENGEVEYQANLSEQEVSFLLEYAINSLMKQGAIPFTMMQDTVNFQYVKQGEPS